MLLQARDLVVVLPGDSGDVRVLDGVSLELEAGSVTDVVGPSGSGKTTLLRALARLLPEMSGSLALDGLSAETVSGTEWRAAVALLPQKPAIVEGTVRDNLLRPWSLKVRHGHAAPDDSALRTALDRVVLDAALERDAARLSVGQQARVALVRTLLTHPRVLLLDEPDAALDELSAAAVSDLTREFADKGGAVVRVRHHRSDDIADRRYETRRRGAFCVGGGDDMSGAAGGVIPIGWFQLMLATGFVFFVGIVSIRLSLGITKDLAIATLRTYVQLLALGFILRWVFGVNSPWLVVGIILLMVLFAARILVQRSPDAPKGIFGSAFVSMALTGFIVTFSVTGVIVQVEPWYLPQYVIPLAGMVIGNSMTGIALALERVFADMDAREGELLALTALGATPWEAAHGSIRLALRAGMIPTINSMAAAGLVFIPGMMAGQILAGADPVTATGYQIVVMLMVAAATAMGSVVALLLTYHRRFSADGVFIEKGFRSER